MLSLRRIANIKAVNSQPASFELGSKPAVSLHFKIEDRDYLVVGKHDQIWVYGGSAKRGVVQADEMPWEKLSQSERLRGSVCKILYQQVFNPL